jgi:F0F1-type ATP synthase epsilon subunit
MLRCTVVSPLGEKTVQGLDGIFLRTVTGEIGILAGHMPIVAQLADGSVARLKIGGAEVRIRLGNASFFQFKADEGILLTREFSVQGESAPSA